MRHHRISHNTCMHGNIMLRVLLLLLFYIWVLLFYSFALSCHIPDTNLPTSQILRGRHCTGFFRTDRTYAICRLFLRDICSSHVISRTEAIHTLFNTDDQQYLNSYYSFLYPLILYIHGHHKPRTDIWIRQSISPSFCPPSIISQKFCLSFMGNKRCQIIHWLVERGILLRSHSYLYIFRSTLTPISPFLCKKDTRST